MTDELSSHKPRGDGPFARLLREALSRLATAEVSQDVIRRALVRAKLSTVPDEPIAFASFACGPLHDAMASTFGDDAAEAVLTDLSPAFEAPASPAERPSGVRPSTPTSPSDSDPVVVIVTDDLDERLMLMETLAPHAHPVLVDEPRNVVRTLERYLNDRLALVIDGSVLRDRALLFELTRILVPPTQVLVYGTGVPTTEATATWRMVERDPSSLLHAAMTMVAEPAKGGPRGAAEPEPRAAAFSEPEMSIAAVDEEEADEIEMLDELPLTVQPPPPDEETLAAMVPPRDLGFASADRREPSFSSSPELVIAGDDDALSFEDSPARSLELSGPELIIGEDEDPLSFEDSPARSLELSGPELIIGDGDAASSFLPPPRRDLELSGPELIIGEDEDPLSFEDSPARSRDISDRAPAPDDPLGLTETAHASDDDVLDFLDVANVDPRWSEPPEDPLEVPRGHSAFDVETPVPIAEPHPHGPPEDDELEHFFSAAPHQESRRIHTPKGFPRVEEEPPSKERARRRTPPMFDASLATPPPPPPRRQTPPMFGAAEPPAAPEAAPLRRVTAPVHPTPVNPVPASTASWDDPPSASFAGSGIDDDVPELSLEADYVARGKSFSATELPVTPERPALQLTEDTPTPRSLFSGADLPTEEDASFVPTHVPVSEPAPLEIETDDDALPDALFSEPDREVVDASTDDVNDLPESMISDPALPVVPPEVEPKRKAPVLAAPKIELGPEPPCVLIAHESFLWRERYAAPLRRAGYATLHSSDERGAFDRAKQRNPAAILVGLNEKDGLSLRDRLVAHFADACPKLLMVIDEPPETPPDGVFAVVPSGDVDALRERVEAAIGKVE